MNASGVSVVIVNWNSGDQLMNCLSSLSEYGHGEVEKIVVVDNGSTDSSMDAASSLQAVTIVRSEVNLGFATACNLGARQTDLLVAVALPAQAVSATYLGVNEAYAKFVGISVLRVSLGVANFGGPYLVALKTSDLRWLVSTIVVSRIFALLAYRHLAVRCLPDERHDATIRPDGYTTRTLLRFGGWFTVSSVLGPIMVQADRFFVGAMISVAAVTAYVLPFELVVTCRVSSDHWLLGNGFRGAFCG